MARNRSRLDHAKEASTLPRGIAAGSDSRLIVPGVVVEVDTSGNRVKVAVNGGSGSWVPAIFDGHTYVAGRTVAILRNPLLGGRGELCIGPYYPNASTPPDEESIPSAPPEPETSVTRTVTLTPSWSGTWRADRSAYDRWNVDRYGGRSTLYQGSAHGSGSLTGLAVFGNQIKNLNATTITSMKVTLRGANLNEASYPSITVRPATNGTKPAGAPSTAGTTASGSPGRAGVVKTTLDSGDYASFADGTYKGIALTGASYGAVRGTSAADGMALEITYTTPA